MPYSAHDLETFNGNFEVAPDNPNFPGVGRPELQNRNQQQAGQPRQGLFGGMMGMGQQAVNPNPGFLGQMFPRAGQMFTNAQARRAQFATNHPFLSNLFQGPLHRANLRDNAAADQARAAAAPAAGAGGAAAPMGYAPTPVGAPAARPPAGQAAPAGGIISYNYGPDTIRNQPISSTLNASLTTAAQRAGITGIVVNSGGQDATGTNRTGSTRHDHGNAADIQLVVNGRVLDFTNPQDQEIFQDFVREARAAGVTGVGAGTDYMGNNTIHVGYGGEAVWGGDSENPPPPPDWLVTAYNGGS